MGEYIEELLKVLIYFNSYLEIRIFYQKRKKRFSRMTNLTGPCPLVLCGPSGSGKSTVMKKLMGEYGEYFGFSVSHTTRQPRPGEQDGKDYHYVQGEDAGADRQRLIYRERNLLR